MAKCLVLFILAVANVLAATSKPHQGKIVGGSDAPDGAYPYQVSIRVNGRHNCGGSIIHKEWIVTAAHCVKGHPTQSITIVAGSNRLNDEVGGIPYVILQAYYHEKYIGILIKNDVGLFKVKPIIFTNKVQPIVLDDEEIGGGVACTLSGWGRLKAEGQVPNNLQHIQLNTTTHEFCQTMVPNVAQNEICTLTKAGEGACSGDSGGPLVRKVGGVFKQIGVVSYARPCALGYPDGYARVSSFISWFREKCKCI